MQSDPCYTAKRPDPVHSSMSKEEKRWVAWGTAEGVRVIGVSCTNAIQGWCNLIDDWQRGVRGAD